MAHRLGFNVVFHRGLTYDLLPRILEAHPGQGISFLHLDLDTYEGTLHALETCRERLGVGSMIVFDDLLVLNGQMRAFFEFQQRHGLEYSITSWGCNCMMANSSKRIRRQQYFDQVVKDPWQLVLGMVHYASWDDYLFTLSLPCNPTAVGVRVTGLGGLRDR
mmetsp:Transcript_96926/g.312956  ORF Transcript_96926/g.312956 Transcript_96926/m.312956 type:complete len:162 (-) Transcript_96926:60-545(-)